MVRVNGGLCGGMVKLSLQRRIRLHARKKDKKNENVKGEVLLEVKVATEVMSSSSCASYKTRVKLLSLLGHPRMQKAGEKLHRCVCTYISTEVLI